MINSASLDFDGIVESLLIIVILIFIFTGFLGIIFTNSVLLKNNPKIKTQENTSNRLLMNTFFFLTFGVGGIIFSVILLIILAVISV